MSVFLIFGVLALLAGLLSLSQATMGAGLIAAACFLGIVARIVQAADHQKHVVKLLKAQRDAAPVASGVEAPART